MRSADKREMKSRRIAHTIRAYILEQSFLQNVGKSIASFPRFCFLISLIIYCLLILYISVSLSRTQMAMVNADCQKEDGEVTVTIVLYSI